MSLDVNIYHKDSGVIIRVDCKTDCTTAISRKMMIKKKDTDTITEVTAEQDLDNVNYIKYIVPNVDSPFTANGRYMIRSKIRFSGSQEQQGDPVEIVVGESWTVTT